MKTWSELTPEQKQEVQTLVKTFRFTRRYERSRYEAYIKDVEQLGAYIMINGLASTCSFQLSLVDQYLEKGFLSEKQAFYIGLFSWNVSQIKIAA